MDLTPLFDAWGAGYFQKNWVGVCGPLPKTLTLFMTKICDFSYPIYDLAGVKRGTGRQCADGRRGGGHDEEVASSKKNEFKTRVQKSIPYLLPQWRQNCYNRYPIYDQDS